MLTKLRVEHHTRARLAPSEPLEPSLTVSYRGITFHGDIYCSTRLYKGDIASSQGTIHFYHISHIFTSFSYWLEGQSDIHREDHREGSTSTATALFSRSSFDRLDRKVNNVRTIWNLVYNPLSSFDNMKFHIINIKGKLIIWNLTVFTMTWK